MNIRRLNAVERRKVLLKFIIIVICLIFVGYILITKTSQQPCSCGSEITNLTGVKNIVSLRWIKHT